MSASAITPAPEMAPPFTTKLKNPPIVEAVIDIGTTPLQTFRVEDLAGLNTRFSEDYPDVQELRKFAPSFQFDLSSPGMEPTITPSAHAPAVDHYRFASRQRLDVAQLSRDGLSFSRLAPYTSWEAIYEQARKFWNEFRSIAKPTRVTRIGVRYINRILLPWPIKDLRAYLPTIPATPQGLPTSLGNFVSQVVIPIEGDILAVVVLTLERGPGQGYIPIILDVNVVQTCDLEPGDDDALMSGLQRLREIKNKAFYGSLTAQTIQLFQP